MKEIEKYTALRDKTLSEIKRDFLIVLITLIILATLGIAVGVRNIKLERNNKLLNKEKKALEEYIETQSSMISDLEENCRELYIRLEDRATEPATE